MKARLRPIIAVLVLALTAVAFIYFFAKHPEVGHKLKNTSLSLLIWLLILYLLSILALAMATVATLRVCRLTVRKSEAFLLTAYSAVINFFGPLQSGPALRAVYLKKKYSLDLKKYAAASLIYLFFWGVYSGLMLLSGLLRWWLLALIALALITALFIKRIPLVKRRLNGLDLRWWLYLAVATLAQISIVAVIYFYELRSVSPGVSFSQAITYTGAANLALYVSLTPGAIGFRESFLVFSQRLHHISTTNIVAASILDRAAYIILLLILALFIFLTHAKRQFDIAKER